MEYGDLKITILMRNKPKLLANANISFNSSFGMVTIKGFQIWKSPSYNSRLQEAVNITPPSIQFRGTYVQQVFFENKENWYEMERLIYSEFIKNGGHLSEEVNIDDIPENL